MATERQRGSGQKRRRSAARPAYDLVVLAASSGGVSTLGSILADLPRNFGVPILVVQHRGTRQPEVLTAVLSLRTALATKLADDGESLRKGTVYVVPPHRTVRIRPDRTLAVGPARRSSAQVEPILESAAEVFGAHTVAVILTIGDGVIHDDARPIHDVGGLVLLQREAGGNGAEEPRLPASVDRVLPLVQIAPTLVELVQRRRAGRRRKAPPADA